MTQETVVGDAIAFTGGGGERVTALSDGGFLVTYSKSRIINSSTYETIEDIFGQRFNADGSSNGGAFQVNSPTNIDQKPTSYHAAATLSDGSFVVTWEASGVDGSSTGVLARRYSVDGAPQGDQFQVNSYTSGIQGGDLAIAALSDGGFVITWDSGDVTNTVYQDGSDYGVYGQRYTANGAASGSEFRVNTYTSGFQGRSTVTGLPDGGFVVVWASADQDGDGAGIYGQRYAADGNPSGGEFQVNTTTSGHQFLSDAVALPDGGFVVAWGGYGVVSGSLVAGVFGQRYSSGGAPIGGEFMMVREYDRPSIAPMPDGGFLVVARYMAQRFAADATAIGDAITLPGSDYSEWETTAALTGGQVAVVRGTTYVSDAFLRLVTLASSNTPPTASGSDLSLSAGGLIAAGNMFSVTDSNSDSITQYEFWDSNADAGSGYFSVNGEEQGANQIISVSAEQLASTNFRGGGGATSDQLWVRAYDGAGWSEWVSWTASTTGGNTAPTVSAGDANVNINTQNSIASLFSVSDSNSDSITQYEFWDSGSEQGGGYFTVDGVAQNPNETISVSASQLASTYFVGGSRSVSDLVWVRAYDGASWSEWQSWTLTSNGSAPTVSVTGSAQMITSGTSASASSLFSATASSGQSITQYEFWDSNADAGSGYFSVNGSTQGANQVISVSSSALSSTSFVAGTANVSDSVWVRVYDGGTWSDWTNWTMGTTGGNAPPTVSGTATSLSANTSVAVSSLFSASDPTPDTITNYELWDSGLNAGSGYFTVDGTQQGAGRLISVSATQFASATFTGGATSGSEQIWARATDGTGWSEWTALTVTTAAAGAAMAAASDGRWMEKSMLAVA